MRAACPEACVGGLRTPDDQHLFRHRDPNAVRYGAQAPVAVAEPTVRRNTLGKVSLEKRDEKDVV